MLLMMRVRVMVCKSCWHSTVSHIRKEVDGIIVTKCDAIVRSDNVECGCTKYEEGDRYD